MQGQIVYKHTAIKCFFGSDREAQYLIDHFANSDDLCEADSRSSLRQKSKFLIGRAVLRALLSDKTGSPDWRILVGENGKIRVANDRNEAGPHISLSHTCGFAASALSTVPIGIDVEQWRPRNVKALAEYAFGSQERQEVEVDGIAAFYRIWTVREAKSKITGNGLAAVINGDDSAGGINIGWQNKCGKHIFYSIPKKGYSLALVVEDQQLDRKNRYETALQKECLDISIVNCARGLLQI